MAKRSLRLGMAALVVLVCAAQAAQAETPGGFWDTMMSRPRLTGDWGGSREMLSEHGIDIGLYYTGDVFGIPSGGRYNRTSYSGVADVTLTVDAEKLIGWKGFSLFFSGVNWHGGHPNKNAGSLQPIDHADPPKTFRVLEAWAQQSFFDKRLSILAGLYNVNSEFDAIQTGSIFLNGAHGPGAEFGHSGLNGPSSPPFTSAGVRLRAEPYGGLYVQGAVLDGVPGSLRDSDGTQIHFEPHDGVLVTTEIGWVHGRDDDDGWGYGKIGLGGWVYSSRFNVLGRFDGAGVQRRDRGYHGVYLFAEQTLWREPGAPDQGLAAYVRYGYGQPDFNVFGHALAVGAVYTGAIPGRDQDRIGLAVFPAFTSSGFRQVGRNAGQDVDGAETVIELTYRAKITPWLSIQPDIQYIDNAGAHTMPGVGHALALGARIECSF